MAKLRLMRLFNIVRHPIRWACGCCFICGYTMLFDDFRWIGNHHGFCYTHGTSGSYGAALGRSQEAGKP